MNKFPSSLARYAFIGAIALLSIALAEAQTTWSNAPTTGQITNDANWAGGTAPADNTSWVFTNSSTYTLTNGFNNYTVAGITFANYTGSAYAIGGNAFTLTGGITNQSIYDQRISNNLTINSAITLTNTTNGYITLVGTVTGNGAITAGAANANGRVVLTGNWSGYTGTFTWTTIGRFHANAISMSASADYVFNTNNNVWLTSANTNYTVGSISGLATVANLSAGTNTFGVGYNNSSTTFAGNVSSNQTGLLNFAKAGTGTLTLSGTNTYAGSTTISNGVLQIGAGGTTGSISNTTNISLNGGWLAFNRSDNISQGVNFLSNNAIISGTNTTGGLIKMGAGTLSLTAANTFSGTTRVDAGKLVLSNNLAIQNSALDTAGAGVLSLASGITTPTLGGLTGNGAFAPENYSTVTALTLNTAAGANLTYSGVLSNGAAGMTLTKSGAGTQTLSGNNSYSGGTALNAGTLGVGNSSGLGSGTLTVSGSSTLQAAADGLNIANNAALSTGVLTIDSQNFNLTNSGTISGNGALSKAGAGTLTLSGNNIYSGGTTLNGGTLAVSGANGLGLSTGDLTFAGSSTLLLNSSFSSSRNYILGAAATIDTAANNLTNTGVVSGTGVLTKAGNGTLTLMGTNTHSGAMLLSAGTLTVGGAGLLNGGNYSSAITNNAIFHYASSANQTLSGIISGSGSLTKSGPGTLTLSGVSPNTYSGKTTVSGGVLSIGNFETRMGANPVSFVADQLTLDGGTLAVGSLGTWSANRGITLGSGGGTIDVSTNFNAGAVITGVGPLTKMGAGTLRLVANTFSGGFNLNEGVIRLVNNSSVTAGVVNSGPVGTGTLTINGGRIMGVNGGLYATAIVISNDFAVNLGAAATTDNGRLSMVGPIDLAGGTRTVSLGRWTNATGAMAAESMRLIIDNGLLATVTNGTLRVVRDVAGTASDYVGFGLNASNTFYSGAGLTIGTNVITVIGTGNPFGTIASNQPHVTVESGGYFNMSDATINARSPNIRTLSGNGTVTSLGNSNAATTSTLTINPQSGDIATFSGQIVDGASLNGTLGTTATATVALVKSGAGTQILSGSNTYSGTTTISASGGLLQFAKTTALYGSDTASWDKTKITVQSGGAIGFNVGGTGEFTAADVTTILAGLGGAVNNNGLRGGSAVAFDTANASGGSFGITNNIANSTGTGGGTLGLTKLGANTLTLSGANTFSGALDVRAGTLEVASVGGAAAGSVGSINIASSAVLLVSQSNQANNSAAVTLSGGTIQRGSGVSEVFGNLNLTDASFLNFGSGTAGTMSFGTYTPSSLLTVQNFFPGNTLTFKSDLTGTINNGSLFSFDSGFSSSWSSGTSTFTITAIPEPSTMLAALLLLGLFAAPVVRRLLPANKPRA